MSCSKFESGEEMVFSKFRKIITCLLVVLILFSFGNCIYAEINEDYYNQNLGAFKVADTKDNLSKKTLASILLDAIGSLVYALASLGEWLLGNIFQAATGGDAANNIFPWADAIVFNAIPFLDINFLNPHSTGTVVGLIQDVLKSTYGTIFGLAISFFSIAVMVAGVKVAVSTIASEKAKYKQALWDWAVGLMLLFTIHIFIAFVFYLNESLVDKASNIASTSLNSKQAKQVLNVTNNITDYETAVDNFIDAMGSLKINDILTAGLGRLIDGIDSSNLPDLETSKSIVKSNAELSVILLQDERYRYWRFGDRNKWYVLNASSSDAFWTWSRGDNDLIRVLAANVQYLTQNSDDLKSYEQEYKKLKEKSDKTDNEKAQMDFYASQIEAYKYYVKKEGSGSGKSLIANLAQYFKNAAWTFGSNSWKTDKVVIQNAIMYAILVVQSFIFLIAYVKRLFYVIMLAMMAPAVVVYDFFNKTIS